MVAPVSVNVTETIWIQWKERVDHHQRSDEEEDGREDDLVKEFGKSAIQYIHYKRKIKWPGHKAFKKKKKANVYKCELWG